MSLHFLVLRQRRINAHLFKVLIFGKEEEYEEDPL